MAMPHGLVNRHSDRGGRFSHDGLMSGECCFSQSLSLRSFILLLVSSGTEVDLFPWTPVSYGGFHRFVHRNLKVVAGGFL